MGTTLYLALAHRDDLPRIEKALAAALDGKGEYDIEFRMLNRDGTARWTASRAAIMRDETGPKRLNELLMPATIAPRCPGSFRLGHTEWAGFACADPLANSTAAGRPAIAQPQFRGRGCRPRKPSRLDRVQLRRSRVQRHRLP